MKAKTYQFMMTALLFLFAMDTYGQSDEDKEEEIIENTYHAGIVKQETDCWCVYACLQSIKSSSQCSECEKYIQDFLLDDYRSGNNPYPESFMSNDDFRAAMYLFDSCQVTPCNGREFAGFGAKVSDLEAFIGFKINYTDLCNLFQVNNHGPSLLAVSIEGEHAHCVAIYSSKVYDSVNNEKSTVTIMDPSMNGTKDLTFKEFADTYKEFYSPTPIYY